MLVDVRSPSEYAHGHIPGALSLPLFNDEERALVGLTYKKEGRHAAFSIGLSLIEPKIDAFIDQAQSWEEIQLYCWRGGMRSESMEKLFLEVGLNASRLQGGYKAYRREVLATLNQPYRIKILSGMTGCGKTESLRKKEQYIDLEELANHRGSPFGFLGLQPSNEHFENLIAGCLKRLDAQKTIWLEDESRLIGRCKIPDALFIAMQRAERETLFCSRDRRIERLVQEYGNQTFNLLEKGILQIEKRLGSQRTREALNLLKNNQLHNLASLLLDYYDKAYEKSQKRYNQLYEHTLSR